MAKLIILGSSYSIPDETHENTHMVIVGEQRNILIDCVGNPILRLRQANITFDNLTDLVLTHFHPDHVSGVPLLLMDMWLMGRRKELHIYGLHHTLDRTENLMGFYNWETWPDFFPVVFHRLPAQEMMQVIDSPEIKIYSSPVRHLIPTIGLRVEFSQYQRSMAYSCDTEPCDEVVRLAAGVDVLIHEATGESVGHSSPAQAGSIAAQAGAKALYLIHYPTGNNHRANMLEEVRGNFSGPVDLARDFMTLDFSQALPA